jgi:aryl-alcohol dehydrogenase-like predicted oxidoreductase
MHDAGAGPAAAAGDITLGKELTVRRLGFGARWITWAGPDGSAALLRRALELGINLIDTADVYDDGESERMIANALHPYPSHVVIATKGGQVSVDGKPRPNGRPEHLRAACEGSLQRLRLDAIGLYQLHNPDPEVPLEESLGTLVRLRDEGKIRHVGVSNLFGDALEQVLRDFPIVSVQNQYSLRERVAERSIATCERHGVAFMPWSPLAAGGLAGHGGGLAEAAAAHGATPAQVSIAWLLARSPVMLAIPGTSSIEHLEENTAAAGLHLSDEERDRISDDAAASDPPPSAARN